MPYSPADTSELALITVSFNPDFERFCQQTDAIPEDARLIVVDNASAPEVRDRLKDFLAPRPNSTLVLNSENLGLAAAINRGADHVRENFSTTRYLLLMDQDSIPAPGAIQSLLDAYHELEASHPSLGCVGPLLIDASTGLSHGFHQIRGWRWTRSYPSPEEKSPIPCANLNGSGTLVSRELFEKLGGLDESFFIDHIDTDWAFRVLASGHELLGIPWAKFDHAMGEKSLRFWLFGWKLWPQRSPLRHYYLFRNAVRLMGRGYVPGVWKFWATIKLLLTLCIHLIVDPLRWKQARCMLCGIHDGLSRTGKSNAN